MMALYGLSRHLRQCKKFVIPKLVNEQAARLLPMGILLGLLLQQPLFISFLLERAGKKKKILQS